MLSQLCCALGFNILVFSHFLHGVRSSDFVVISSIFFFLSDFFLFKFGSEICVRDFLVFLLKNKRKQPILLLIRYYVIIATLLMS